MMKRNGLDGRMRNVCRVGAGSLVGASVSLSAGAMSSSPADPPPNIILILADDLGYADLSCYGGTRMETPNIDRLAAEGVRFTDFHSNGPMCSPTRAALLTGRYQQRVGIERALGAHDSGFPDGTVTIAERLQDAGYKTAIFGKWHLGTTPESNPVHHGFDQFNGHMYGAGDYIAHINRIGERDWWRDTELKNEEGYSTTLHTEHTVDFIEKNKDRPFFVYLSHSAIHFPWMGPQDEAYRNLGQDYRPWTPDTPPMLSKLGPHENAYPVITQMLKELDESTGEVLDTLERLGLDENTIVLFTSDNGGYRDYKGTHAGELSNNGPFRGQKMDVYEGGHRVPAMVRWPSKIKADGVISQTVLTMDLYPTILNFAGLPAQDQPALDGMDIRSLLQSGSLLPERTLFWRMGEKKAVRQNSWKLVRDETGNFELYDLNKDPAEQSNIALDFPDRVRSMREALSEWEQDVDAK